MFDVSTGSTSPLSMTVPLYSNGNPYAVLIHDSDYISYKTTFVDYRNRFYSNLVITDTKTNQSFVIPNSPGRRWNANFTCLYNDELISCIEKRDIIMKTWSSQILVFSIALFLLTGVLAQAQASFNQRFYLYSPAAISRSCLWKGRIETS